MEILVQLRITVMYGNSERTFDVIVTKSTAEELRGMANESWEITEVK